MDGDDLEAEPLCEAAIAVSQSDVENEALSPPPPPPPLPALCILAKT